MTLNEVKQNFIEKFREAGLEASDLDARLLIMAATGLTQAELIARGAEYIAEDKLAKLKDYAQRRLSGEPIDHILGYRDFYGRRFLISKDVLSPRPETEMLVQATLRIIKNKPKARILDLGTGSGAIIISILAEAPDAEGMAVDISAAALSMAKENAAAHGVIDRLTFAQGSWFEPVRGKFDIILSNPPYISDAAMRELDVEVSDYDPDIALRGGADGLAAYRAIISAADNHLLDDGRLLLEIGYDQGGNVPELLRAAGFGDIGVEKDLSGHDRLITAVKQS